jgi:hypothetical protein
LSEKLEWRRLTKIDFFFSRRFFVLAAARDLLFVVSFNKLFERQAGLPDGAAQRTKGQLFVPRYHTALVLPAHDHVAALFASLIKSKPDKPYPAHRP